MAAAILLSAGVSPIASGAPETGPFLSAYAARNSPDRLVDILRLRASTTDEAWLGALAWGQPVWRGTRTRLELEGQLVRHAGIQEHWEINAVVAVRWTEFPWDRYLDTSIAVGEGLSYATEMPPLEPRGDADDEEESSRLLNYLMVEAEFMVPRTTRWATFIRVHHRSGVFGAFGEVEGGSNFVGLGVRHHFE